MGRGRRKSDISKSARRRHFIGSNRRAPKKNNSRNSDVAGQGESASRRTCKWRSQHPGRQGYFGKDVPTEWHDRTDRAVFTWQESCWKGGTVSLEDRKSTWTSGVRKAIRWGSAEEEVRKHQDRETGALEQISKQRPQVDESYDPSILTALQHGTWMDEEGFKKTCIKEKGKKGGTHQPLYSTWVADCMLKQDAGRFMLRKYLSDK